MSDEHEVEAIIGHRVFRGKEQYLVKWRGYDVQESTWEPIQYLFNVMDLVAEYVKNKEEKTKELDYIIGCGQRNGQKFFLVRFKGEHKNEIIDWESAKQYSVAVMEFFGARSIWTEVKNIIDPEMCEGFQENATRETVNDERDPNEPSTSQLDACPNEIEFDK
ncbi:chromobox protein homolog 1-like [Sitodiplosis mosellana]|uniref:chromobox protein homolog 1-like n=1 Tax=Sitodiplosis mosellana TaxID=263140 RepID=UPI00244518B4|nr:chromobox protein homolog 1-like [Sitodiplosis mosellana]